MSCRSTQVFQDSDLSPKVKEELIVPLSKQLKESSGLLIINDYFLSFNDSGGKNILYAFKKESPDSIIEINIPGSMNVDWEDILKLHPFYNPISILLSSVMFSRLE
ncbi:MAG: hypothetical protein KAS71_01155 [Bacteroidales bacterium]|nr:hypothetical protein [Bacteroidales bacterium]